MRRDERSKILAAMPLYTLLLPAFALLGVFSLVPFVWSFSTALYRFEVGETPQFVGLSNYTQYLRDPTFWVSFRNMLLLTGFAVIVNIVVPLSLAKLILSLSSDRASYLYRILFLIPIVVPGVATQLIWGELIYGETGLLNWILANVGLSELQRSWLSDPHSVIWAIAMIGFPFAGGINILIYYAGLAAIPESVHEAAWLDGVTGIRKFLGIDLPLVLTQIRLMVVLTVIGGVQSFEAILVLTRGGPGFNSMVPGLWMYFNAFTFQRMGYACAIGVILFVLILGLTVLNLRYFKSSEEVQAQT
jgi:raffinose/stachyose/melibiose transport system permease protein